MAELEMAPIEREYIIQSIIWSQSLAGITVTREMAESAFDQAAAEPIVDLG